MENNGKQKYTFPIAEPAGNGPISLLILEIIGPEALRGGDGGKFGLLDNAGEWGSFAIGALGGALSDCNRPFGKRLTGMPIGGDKEGDWEKTGEG